MSSLGFDQKTIDAFGLENVLNWHDLQDLKESELKQDLLLNDDQCRAFLEAINQRKIESSSPRPPQPVSINEQPQQANPGLAELSTLPLNILKEIGAYLSTEEAGRLSVTSRTINTKMSDYVVERLIGTIEKSAKELEDNKNALEIETKVERISTLMTGLPTSKQLDAFRSIERRNISSRSAKNLLRKIIASCPGTQLHGAIFEYHIRFISITIDDVRFFLAQLSRVPEEEQINILKTIFRRSYDPEVFDSLCEFVKLFTKYILEKGYMDKIDPYAFNGIVDAFRSNMRRAEKDYFSFQMTGAQQDDLCEAIYQRLLKERHPGASATFGLLTGHETVDELNKIIGLCVDSAGRFNKKQMLPRGDRVQIEKYSLSLAKNRGEAHRAFEELVQFCLSEAKKKRPEVLMNGKTTLHHFCIGGSIAARTWARSFAADLRNNNPEIYADLVRGLSSLSIADRSDALDFLKQNRS
ncbi:MULTISPECIES: hypothetical protein, partial [unclassified Caballeronia]|uniref:hypothetical protein n=1 Tax=unclassified Caballeronia TaxID=2646786 RepID=UPI00202850BE